jgi:hypothetical protein
MCRYQGCCWCFTAYTGAIVIAILSIIGSGLCIITESIFLGFVGQIQFRLPFWVPAIYLQPLLISEIVGHSLNLFINGCMLYGVTNNQYGMVLLWLIFGMIRLLTYTIGVIGGFVILCLPDQVYFGGLGYGFILIGVATPFMTIGYYFWFVVRSVYYDIKENDLPK